MQEIDFLGLALANILAIIRASQSLKTKPDLILVDGNLKFFSSKYFSIIKGDSLVKSISAASIVAKVYRDNIMDQLHEEFPIYNWLQNKGYGTLQHREQIQGHGTCLHHRSSFNIVN